ncbi:MAG: lysophospholipase [Erysipelotrichaceae bacterium]|nr:lysophospholipase [Erysipelotrichaceae bacterium]
MKKEEFRFRSSDGKTDIIALRFIPDGEVKAILQIAHGMVEFIDRYEDFASYLAQRGYLVTGNDHLGHGGSVESKDDWGYFGDDGYEYVLQDMHELTRITKEFCPDKPYYLLGHSMGSFFARNYLAEYGNELDGAIIMGTGLEPAIKIKGGMMMCSLIALFKGWRYRSPFINNMAFGSYNKKFEPARTRADWLSRDEKLVDWYVNEERCSFVFTLNGFYQMFRCILNLHNKEALNRIPKDLPILFVAGADDPVGTFGKEIEKSIETLKDVGVKNIEYKLYPEDRHEILNELDKETVYEDLYRWLETKEI